MFRRTSHLLIALLSIALHATDMVVAVAGHHHTDERACTTCVPCGEHVHAHHHGGHSHTHAHCHHGDAHPAADGHDHGPPARPHSHHHNCAICRHLALTPALVAPPPVALTAQTAEPICLTANVELPPHRAIPQRSRAPPGFPA
jgi:hypothetical protein